MLTCMEIGPCRGNPRNPDAKLGKEAKEPAGIDAERRLAWWGCRYSREPTGPRAWQSANMCSWDNAGECCG